MSSSPLAFKKERPFDSPAILGSFQFSHSPLEEGSEDPWLLLLGIIHPSLRVASHVKLAEEK